MPAKRKTGGGVGRGKRLRQSSPDVESSGEKILAGQQAEEKDAPMAPPVTEEDSNKTIVTDGEADADGEVDDDKIDVTHDIDAEGEREELTQPKVEEQQPQDISHEPVPEGDEDHEGDIARPMSSTRGRGRSRGRRARGVVPGSTRSSPRKASQQTQEAQHTSKPANRRGRKAARGRGRGVATSSPPPADPPADGEAKAGAGEEDGAKNEENKEQDEDEDKEGREEAKVKVGDHQSLSQPIMSPQPHQGPQHSHQIHSADQSVHTSATPFPPQSSAYYPNYPPQATHFQYTYGAPPPPTVAPSAPDGRPYLALRPDEAQPVYSTSFTTTVGTTENDDSNSASSFNVPYPAAAAAVHAHALDVNAPQGNPFPPSAPMPVPAYSENVYKVNVSGDEDEDDQDHEQSVGVQAPSQKKKAQVAAGKGGGRTGRGDHVACHFCRGRKLKCDGRRPTCGHCAKRIHACEYDPNVRRRGPGRKEKNNRHDRNGSNSKRPGVIISGLNVNPQASTSSHTHLMTTLSTEVVKRKRRQSSHAVQSQAGVLRFESGDGTSAPGPAMKPATAAYGVENNERLGFYYAGGGPGQFGPPYPPYGAYDQAANTHHPTQQASYGYAQNAREDEADGNADMDADGEGDGDHDVYDSQQEGSSYGQPPNGNYSHAWPAEPPGGEPASHPQHL